MSVPIRTRPAPRDPIARAHRRAKIFHSLIATTLLVTVTAGILWLGQYLLRRHAQVTTPISEKVAIGVWCRLDDCQYFDRTGARWGSVPRSQGPLLLLVQDDRIASESEDFPIQAILSGVDGLPKVGARALSVTLPESAPGDMHVATDKKYDLIFDIYGDVADQLTTLGVLLADKAKDSAFAPQYIDLRTPGRVYYK